LLDNGHLHGDCITVTGRTIAENLKKRKMESAPGPWCGALTSRSPVTGGVVGLKGNLAPERRDREGRGHVEVEIHRFRPAASIAKMTPSRSVQKKTYKEGEVIVIRYEGPARRPRHAGDALDHGRR